RVARGCDWVVLANPNGSTGRLIAGNDLRRAIAGGPGTTRWLIDESDIDFAGGAESLEALAASTPNVLVFKSMSRAYALSGLGVAYLCGTPSTIAELEPFCPTPPLSLPAQIAACETLKAATYY